MKEFSWCGLSVNFDDGIIVNRAEDTEVDNHRAAKIETVKEVLLNGDLRYPKVVYNRLAGIGFKKDRKNWKKWRHDMLFLSLGVAGVEYVKTEGWKYVSKGNDVPVLVETVMGSVTLILQKNGRCFKRTGVLGEDIWFCADRVVSLRVPRGRKVLVPPGYYIVFVNNSLNPAAVSIIVDKDAEEVLAPFAESRGAAYYAIKKNARLEMVPNPQYRNLHPIRTKRPDHLWKALEMEEMSDLLYSFLSRQHRLIADLFKIVESQDDLFS